MRLRRILASLAGALTLLAAADQATAEQTAQAPQTQRSPLATPATACSTASFSGDARLGPRNLPADGMIGRELTGYRRTGGLSAAEFLSRYHGSGGWVRPPHNGYALGADGRPIVFTTTLLPGQQIDRYGSESGSDLAPEGLPYASRSLPPQSLASNPAALCNYHDYRVLKPFRVDAGPVAPWFGQPGTGLQYRLDGAFVNGAPSRLSVLWLLQNGYLGRADTDRLRCP